MTVSIGTDDISAFGAEDSAPKSKFSAKNLVSEFQAMSKAMVEQKGLLNHAQAGLFLEVSTKRISELVRLGKLTRFDFVGRTYVSYKEVRARRKQDLKAGRPPRGFGKRALLGLQAVANMDLPLAVVEGLTDYDINEPTSKEQPNEPES